MAPRLAYHFSEGSLAEKAFEYYLLAGDAVDPLSHFAVGTGSTTVVVGDTTLDTEVEREVITQFIDASGTLTVKYYMAESVANGNTLAEAGIFNDASAGDMYCRVLISPTIVKTSSIAVTFTWTLTIA